MSFGRIAPLVGGEKVNPVKAGGAKPRGYRTLSRATPVELPNLWEGLCTLGTDRLGFLS
jgi:hypothetical protein